MLRLYFGGLLPEERSHGGPHVFMNRLLNSIEKQNLAMPVSRIYQPYDAALFMIYKRRQLLPRPFVLRVDGIYVDKKNTVGDSKKLNERIFRSIDRSSGVVFISEYSRKVTQAFKGSIGPANVVVNNAVPLDVFRNRGPNMRAQLGIDPSELVIVTSAHWRRHKRLEETLELFRLVKTTLKRECKLLVLGRNTGNIGTEDIIVVGEVNPSELASWYRTGDMFLHLAWIEPCGNTHVEAMACGLPTLCTNNGGVGEAVRASCGGIVSNADKVYDYTYVDAYDPPKPDYGLLLSDLQRILGQLPVWQRRIDRNVLDIDNAAKRYIEFVNRMVKGGIRAPTISR